MTARLAALLLAVALLAGCSSPATDDTTSGATDATTTDGQTSPSTNAQATAPPGWTKDPCDTKEASFSGQVRPAAIFRREGPESARSFADHIVEAAGDRITGEAEESGDATHGDARAWRTNGGFVEVFWALDPAAWSATYTTTNQVQDDPAFGRNATAHAILGSLEVDAASLTWTESTEEVRARRMVGETALPIVAVTDHAMQAEQVQLVRRDIRIDPDYDLPATQRMSEAEARALATTVLECRGRDGGIEMRLAEPQVRIFHSYLAYWFLVEPTAGWETACGAAADGRLHVAVDAHSGTVLSTDLACAAV